MICPHDGHECDNRGCRYGGCQGRAAADPVPRFEENRSQTKETSAHGLADAQRISSMAAAKAAAAARGMHPLRPPGRDRAPRKPETQVRFII
jgi:hypothetical protein